MHLTFNITDNLGVGNYPYEAVTGGYVYWDGSGEYYHSNRWNFFYPKNDNAYYRPAIDNTYVSYEVTLPKSGSYSEISFMSGTASFAKNLSYTSLAHNQPRIIGLETRTFQKYNGYGVMTTTDHVPDNVELTVKGNMFVTVSNNVNPTWPMRNMNVTLKMFILVRYISIAEFISYPSIG